MLAITIEASSSDQREVWHVCLVLSDHGPTIARAYGVGPPVQEMIMVARGEQGRIWRLDTDRGPFAIKELVIRQMPADAIADVAYQEAVLAAGAVQMPRPIRTVAGQVLVDVAGHQVRAYEWVELLAMDRGLYPTMIGATLAAIHRVHYAPARPLIGWYTEPVGAPRWSQLLDEAKAADAPFVEALEVEITELLRLEALIESPTNLQSCHRDLWADNILPTPADGVCVIDWENCGLADPAQELPMAMIDFAFGDQRRLAELYLSYVEAGGPGRVTRYGSFTMVIAQFSHFWESAITAYLSTGAAEVKAHSLDRIAELLNPPLRVEHLGEMLDTIAPIR
jgi:aminoglycoside phosphotransferase (APT) family kinase protein